MKKRVVALLLFCSASISGQGRPETQGILVEYNNISIGKSFAFNDYEIRFVDVLSDSRCPKAVMCIVAGEAVVKVKIYKSGKRIIEKTLTFTPTVFLPNSKGNLYDTELLKVTGVALYPYPVADNQIQKENYSLKLLIEELVE
ncbi:hypothetical protein [uncultured Winogradskyella sp.]|uniref:hypothetical protein n=1 Tax=uncultured Winogradskyella sp. TaxID=395353 RepID=UPI00260233B6|nr:hypothetical protein [uncultured Winogradskyella sp.]